MWNLLPRAFIDKPYKSIGSSEPTYVSRSDDWFKTLPNLVMCNVSINLTFTPYWRHTTLDVFFLPNRLYFGWAQEINSIVLYLLCAWPGPFMNYQYHWVQLLVSLQYLVYQATQVSLEGGRSCANLEGGQKEWKTREKKKVSNFPRNENAYVREIEGGKNEWINWGRRKRWEFCQRWKQNKRGRGKR